MNASAVLGCIFIICSLIAGLGYFWSANLSKIKNQWP